MQKLQDKLNELVSNDFNCDEKEADKLIDRLINRKENIKYYYMCLLYLRCSEDHKILVRENLKENWDQLDTYTVRMSVEGGVFGYNSFVKNTFIELLRKWNSSGNIDVVTDDNPLICLVYLYLYDLVKVGELRRLEKYANSSKMLSFITDTENFDIDQFDENWNFLLKSFEYKSIYDKMCSIKERDKMIKRRREYLNND